MYSPRNNSVVHAEICDVERLAKVAESFPELQVTVIVEKDWKDVLEDLYFHAPFMRDTVRIQIVKKIDLNHEIEKAVTPPVKKRNMFWAIPIGILFGTIMLVPLSNEYNESVALKANTVKELTDGLSNSPEDLSARTKLMKVIRTLESTQDIRSVSYKDGKYKMVLASSKKKADVSYFGLPNAKITNYKVVSKDNKIKYLYEIGGRI